MAEVCGRAFLCQGGKSGREAHAAPELNHKKASLSGWFFLLEDAYAEGDVSWIVSGVEVCGGDEDADTALVPLKVREGGEVEFASVFQDGYFRAHSGEGIFLRFLHPSLRQNNYLCDNVRNRKWESI